MAGRGRLTGKFMSRKKRLSLPPLGIFSPLNGTKPEDARLKSNLSIKAEEGGKKNRRDDNDNDNAINFLLVDRNLCKPVNAR